LRVVQAGDPRATGRSDQSRRAFIIEINSTAHNQSLLVLIVSEGSSMVEGNIMEGLETEHWRVV
jgi:glycerate-2-kinase